MIIEGETPTDVALLAMPRPPGDAPAATTRDHSCPDSRLLSSRQRLTVSLVRPGLRFNRVFLDDRPLPTTSTPRPTAASTPLIMPLHPDGRRGCVVPLGLP